jgi:hypothetical protein
MDGMCHGIVSVFMSIGNVIDPQLALVHKKNSDLTRKLEMFHLISMYSVVFQWQHSTYELLTNSKAFQPLVRDKSLDG